LLHELNAAASDLTALLRDEIELFARGVVKALLLIPVLLLLTVGCWLALNVLAWALAQWLSASMVVAAFAVFGLHVIAALAALAALQRCTKQASFRETRRAFAALTGCHE
jgi:hypothetical protein